MGNSWMIIERVENWEVDAANSFSFFGLSERYQKLAAEITANDLLFCYVSSGISAFSDIRMVQETGLKKLKVQSYTSAFPYCFSTSPVLTLPRNKWIPVKNVAADLELTKGRYEYNVLFRTSLRKLSTHDANYLKAKMQDAAKGA